jgi:hypothetical protein
MTAEATTEKEYILLPVESWDFALAEKAPLHPARPGPSFSLNSNLGGTGYKSATFGVGKNLNFQLSGV